MTGGVVLLCADLSTVLLPLKQWFVFLLGFFFFYKTIDIEISARRGQREVFVNVRVKI